MCDNDRLAPPSAEHRRTQRTCEVPSALLHRLTRGNSVFGRFREVLNVDRVSIEDGSAYHRAAIVDILPSTPARRWDRCQSVTAAAKAVAVDAPH